MTDTITEFEDWLLDNNFAAKTIRNCKGDMRRIQESGTVRSREDFEKWIRAKRLAGMKNVTLNHYLRTINRYCDMKGWEKFRYARELRNMKIRTVTPEERRKIFMACTGYTRYRDLAALHLAFDCGLRIGEISSLTIQDVSEIASGILNVTGKGQKSRSVYVPPQAREAVRKYLDNRIPSDPNALFTGPKGALRYEYIRQRFSRIGSRAGVHFSAHMARHTYATTLLRSGVSIYSVSKLLGHSDLGTTEVYLHLDQREAIEEVKSKMKDFFRTGQTGMTAQREVPIHEIQY